MKDRAIENNLINMLSANFIRSPLQINKIHQSDAEIIKLSDGQLLAVTTDSIAEEIETGLYEDPYLAGWMLVIVNLSDLAAVGAKPLGILISEIIPQHLSNSKLLRLQRGINDAAVSSGTFILGGDTNYGKNMILTGTAIGIIPDNKFISRKGCSPGQLLFSTSFLGEGNAFAASRFLNHSHFHLKYHPSPCLKESEIIKKFAACCIDTSDGFIASLDQLVKINHAGFYIDDSWPDAISPQARLIAKKTNIPEWLLLAGIHGEFQLLFTIDALKENKFLANSINNGWHPLKIGRVIKEPEIRIKLYDKICSIDGTKIRNFASASSEGITTYIHSLLEYDRTFSS